MSDTAPEAIARWMLSRLEENGRLYQVHAAQQITAKFGPGYTYLDDNGNPAIDKRSLRAFRRISGDSVVWDRLNFCWRTREPDDEPGRRQP